MVQTFLRRPVETQQMLALTFKLIFGNDTSPISLLDHASFYYMSLENNTEEVRRQFTALESDMTKYREELSETIFEEDFNSLGIIFKQKEAKYTKPYEYFIAMRNKELGLIEEPQEEEE